MRNQFGLSLFCARDDGLARWVRSGHESKHQTNQRRRDMNTRSHDLELVGVVFAVVILCSSFPILHVDSGASSGGGSDEGCVSHYIAA